MKKSFYYAMGLFLILQSCKTAYIPNALNVPLLREQGEFKFLIAPDNLQAAYAVTEHIGVIANGQMAKSTTNINVNGQPTTNFKQTNSVLEAGVGYLGKGQGNFIYEVFAGGGLTKTYIEDNNGSTSITGKYDAKGLKFFIQPNVGLSTKYFDIAFSPRLTGLQYGTSTTIFSKQYLVDQDLDQLADHTHLFIEPAITLRAGYKFIKVQGQLGVSYKMTSANIPYNDLMGSLGLVIDIARWYNN